MLNMPSYYVEIERSDVKRIYRQFNKSHGDKINVELDECKTLMINLSLLHLNVIERKIHMAPIFWCYNNTFYVEMYNDPLDLYNIGLICDYLELNLNPDNQTKKKKYLRQCRCK